MLTALEKHLEKVPSLVCLFVDLEWNDPNWNHRLGEIVSKLEVLRQLLASRRTQLTIVLLQVKYQKVFIKNIFKEVVNYFLLEICK